jgi:hypothetical protein
MNKLLSIAAAALVSASLALPAEAHVGARPHRHPHGSAGWTPIRADIVRDGINDLEADINRADNNDTISEREAADLRSRLRSLRDQFQRLNRNGLTRGEVTALENRTNYIRNRLRMERIDWDGHAG